MRICPTCRTAYPARGRATCAKDGTRLIGAEEYAASQRDPLLGQTVAGRFRVIVRIGTGGMGTVYRAEQSGLDRQVALKVLKRELISDRDTVARFHREAKAMSMLVHPHTVRVFDFGEDDGGNLFLAMELLEGELLTAWIEREVTPPVLDAVRVIREILRSLGEAHSKSLIHRDLKPDNIFLARVEGSPRPVVKVLDFGIAKVFREERRIDQLETQAGTVFGTPRYMSPEQAQGSALDHRSDLYAVGVLLYQLLTGQPPFLDEDAVVVMAKHIREAPASARKAAPHQPIPRRLERAVMRALAKTPDERYENADAFETELSACVPDIEAEIERLASGRPSGFGEAVRGLPRVPLLIGASLLAASLVVAGVVLAGSLAGAEEPGPTIALPISPPEPSPAEISAASPPTVVATPASVERGGNVQLVSEPPGAEVWVGQERRGVTPLAMALDGASPVEVELRLARHEPTRVALTRASGPVHRVELARAIRRPTGTRPTPAASGGGTSPGQTDEPEYERW